MKVKYLLLDEAFDGLDPVVLETIKNEIAKKAQEGTTVVISTHNISLLERLADRFIILSKGKLADKKEDGDVGVNLVKYQVLFGKDHTQEEFERVGIKIISFKKVGSIIHFITEENVDVKKLINKIDKPLILENIPVDKEESIKLVMISAKEARKHE